MILRPEFQLPSWLASTLPTFGFASVLALAWIAYLPGLSGGFLFDDFVNLNAIGATGPIDNWPSFWRYLTSGTADPTGRPLALLSFLIDARNWPADPAPFLRSNVALHLINGALLFWLLRALGRWLETNNRRNDFAACLGAGLWLLHPLMVSTTLYVVQREAMLPATFVLAGLIAYVHGRQQYAEQQHRIGVAWMIGGIVLGTGLAILCKANGMLLPLLAWVVEATVLGSRRGQPADRPLRALRLAIVVVPSLLVLGYLFTYLSRINVPLGYRPWTIGQRLLTEPRVLADYLQLLLVPRSVSSGLYNDGYLASTSLVEPWTTLPALVLVISAPALAIWHRRRFPALSAAVLFFCAGHLLESTVVPLELYFEHRNYLPAMLFFWPLSRAICAWQMAPSVRLAVAVSLLALLAITTHQRSSLWGQPDRLAALWATQSPESSRAQVTIAMLETRAGHPSTAVRRLEPLWARWPKDLQVAFNYIDAACASEGLSAQDSAKLAHTLQHTDTGVQMINGWLGQAIDAAGSGQCPGLSLADTERWLAAALQNSKVNNPNVRGQDIEPLLARIAIRKQQPDLALTHFNHALAAFTTPDVAARQASVLASNGYYRQALAHLEVYERLKGQVRRPGRGMPWLHAMVLQKQGYWPREMEILRGKLHAEIAMQPLESENSQLAH